MKLFSDYENSAFFWNTGLKLIDNPAKSIGVSAKSSEVYAKSTLTTSFPTPVFCVIISCVWCEARCWIDLA